MREALQARLYERPSRTAGWYMRKSRFGSLPPLRISFRHPTSSRVSVEPCRPHSRSISRNASWQTHQRSMPSCAQTSYHHEDGSWAPLVFLGDAIGGSALELVFLDEANYPKRKVGTAYMLRASSCKKLARTSRDVSTTGILVRGLTCA
jgi:hypothetical protein